MSDIAPITSTTPASTTSRQIRFWGSVARLVVGVVASVAAALIGVSRTDLLLGLVVLPIVEVAIAAARGTNAPQLRLYGNAGHCINWGIGIIVFSFIPVAALLFYGASILLAFARGYAGCEILAISNWLRRRDDQIVCPIFSPIDHAEARRAGVDPEC